MSGRQKARLALISADCLYSQRWSCFTWLAADVMLSKVAVLSLPVWELIFTSEQEERSDQLRYGGSADYLPATVGEQISIS